MLTLKQANKVISGTGFWLPKQDNPRIRVENEDGVYCFTAKTMDSAARRCLEKFYEDTEAFERYQADTNPNKGDTYTRYFKRVRLSDTEFQSIVKDCLKRRRKSRK